MSTEAFEGVKARHKKELKSLEGEERAAIKSAKSRGKKGKGAVKDAEFKYQGLKRDLKEKHRLEIEEMTNGGGEGGGTEEEAAGAGEKTDNGKEETTPQPDEKSPPPEKPQPSPEELEEAKRQRALEKKLRKKNAQRQKEIDRENRIREENSKAGPSRRQTEMEALQTLHLRPRGLDVQEVEADGNCLYRAVGAQCRRLGLTEVADDCRHGRMRELCADVLAGSNRAEYEPFAECGGGGGDDDPATYEEYVEGVRSSSRWGGQLELRALSEGLKCPIVVFSAEGSPLTMGAEYAPGSESDDGGWDKKKALLVSFHRHYYALGEHYNSVIPK